MSREKDASWRAVNLNFRRFTESSSLPSASGGLVYGPAMPAVFVHGNPETPVVWDPLLVELDRGDVVNLQLPGFGAPAPAGFAATKEDYVDWLTAELESLGDAADLVGHDWGGGFVLRVACVRPELIRSWVSDVAGLLDPEYVWHDFAQLWQSAAGEQWVADTLAQPRQARVELLQSVGVTADAAAVFTDALDEEMGRCILALYRSAAQPAMAEWGRAAEAASARPGLVIAPTDDPFTGGTELARRVAERMGARFESLDGLGHWWMLEDPARGARLLQDFWAATA
jgi:pimeloyl-ACP methyl ester carboxylesterase